MNDTFRIAFRAMVVAAVTLLTVSTATAQDTPTGPRVRGNVYGGGNLATVGGSVTVNIKAGTVTGDVYGGGALANTNINNIPTESYTGTGTEEGNTFTYTTTVNLTGGEIHGDAYGGGLGQMGTAVEGVHWTQEEIDAAQEGDDAYGKTTDDWKVEPVEAGADGAGAVKAMVYGDVNVTLGSEGGSTATKFYINHYEGEHAGVVKSGRVFGCNNLNGSPLGNVTVTVWKTVAGSDTRTTETVKTSNKSIIQNNPDNYESVEGYVSPSYELAAVYGGGNLANYTATGKKASVRIETCEVSIQDVYGGGNAAAVPETDVLVRGAYEIQEVFGGGNGKDPYTINDDNNWTDNPGANVNSNATTLLTGGYIHEAYGGSNKRGTIFGSVSIDMSDGSAEDNTNGQCTLLVEKLVGAGKDADVNGDLIMVMGCKPNTKTALLYAGADNANVNGNVELTITSGKFGKVFGGNNKGGIIMGHIKLNIEETGECNVPIEIDELYLGGNEAAYSQYGYYKNGADFMPRTAAMADITDPTANGYTPALTTEQFGATVRNETPYDAPELNIVSCTYIGKVFGGGYGTGATLYGNPTVNINMIQGSNATGIPAKMTELGIDASKAPNPNNLGIIGDVYGGGDAANVIGNTTVNICTVQTVQLHQSYNVSSGEYSMSENQNVLGAYISGNVFGGGKGVDTDVTKALLDGNGSIVMAGGTVLKSVYGGGELSQVSGDTHITVIGGTVGTAGKGGATYGNIYGGGFGSTDDVRFGLIKGDTYVIVRNEVADADYASNHDGVSEGDVLSSPTIIHNIYGGGAYGSVGTFTYESTAADAKIIERTSGGKANITISGGTIGTTGKENGMIFGSSRGDVGAPNAIHDRLAWVYDSEVTVSDGQINGSVYGGGENGHNYHDAVVNINGGTIGIATGEDITDNNGTPDDTSDDITYSGAEYPYRGNVYGGGCGTDKYDTDNDNEGDTYNPLAGIVQGDATVRVTGGTIIHNVYGAGAMGSVGITTGTTSGGKTTISIGGGTIGVSGIGGNGNVFGAARGDKDDTAIGLAQVRETSVTVSAGQVMGNVYGGGEVGNVGIFANQDPVSVGNYTWDTTNTGNGLCTVTISGGKIGPDDVALSKEHGNVFGGGKGISTTFECEKAMVYKTNVTISNGSKVNGTVYGGGEVGRVEGNTVVTIGTENETDEPEIKGNVFAAGAGTKTHGYSALVRGTSSVTVQGKAKVLKNVYGGGEEASVGRYKVKVKNDPLTPSDAPSTLPVGMPYQLISGGTSTVVIQDQAVIGTDGVATTGHVYGAGQGVDPHEVAYTYEDDATKPSRMISGNTWEYFANEPAYLQFVETLALTGTTDVTIGEGATVRGSVFGGSESGFVYHNTKVEIQGGTVNGDAFGGGRGLASFAEAGRVSGNTEMTVSGGAVEGNVYGGGNLGDVGTIKKNTTNYNYTWKNSDCNGNVNATGNDNISGNNKIATDENNKNTGICKVIISGGVIGLASLSSTDKPEEHGNVFGAGEGLATTWWCEKAIAYATNVSVTKGTVYGNVYGGGEVGRVEDDAKVTIGAENGTDEFTITGSVFGAGAGLATHGYSALVRGNAEVTVQGKAQVGGSVYGGGEIASVGRFHVVGGLPRNPQAGGTCTVKILGEAKIGTSGTGHNVFGACKGVDPATINGSDRKSMQLYTNRPKDASGNYKNEHDGWEYYADNNDFIWVNYGTEDDYQDFLKTLALTSNTHVTIGGSSHVYGSVYGGGERGITLGGVDVNMTGGTVYEDVYGGGSLADSNTAMWDATNNTLHDYAELELIPGLSVVTGYYTDKSPETLIAEEDKKADGTKYYAIYKTNVNLKGGTIIGDAYGGGLGQKKYLEAGQAGYVSPIEAMVYGDVTVKLNEGLAGSAKGCAVNHVFGCNNLNGTPKGKVQVYVYATQKSGGENLADKAALNSGSYDVQAVYGGGNLAKYEPVDALLEYNETNKATVDAARPEVYIDGCDLTSIKQVYGGGNAAPVPATYVEINSAYEIDEAFGGGNGKDDYSLKEGNATKWYQNPGANVGYYTYSDYPKTSGNGSGTAADPYKFVQDPRYDETVLDEDGKIKEARLAATDIQYGSGIATLVVKGGTIHSSYGGSNLRGNVRVRLSSRYSAMNDDCAMAVGTSYGGGNQAFSDGTVDMVADCAKGVTEMFGGSKNADFDGDINMLITNGSSLQRVFGGNNTSGAVNGSITITIKEGGCEPIRIGELYAGGYLAPYSVYGYKKTGDTYDYIEKQDEKGNTIQERIPLTAADVAENFVPRPDPRINVVSATYIGNIFGGGYKAKLVGNPHINVNMEPGRIKASYSPTVGEHTDYSNHTYDVQSIEEGTGDGILPIGTIGNIYGGGNLADIVGDTYVEIGTGKWVKLEKDDAGNYSEVEETLARNAATITGNVFGGGKGQADTFQCEKGMVGVNGDGIDHPEGGTYITIGNGTVGTLDGNGKLVEGTGNVYGGGEIGRVEKNTMVTIGLAAADVPEGLTSSPVIEGSVFGGGKGKETHGYAALVRGNPTVIIQGNAKVGHNVYGGGEIASVARYQVVNGVPVALAQVKEGQHSGYCTVIVKDNAEIGPDGMKMYHSDITDGSDKPDDWGHVFGAGKGFLPDNYTYENNDNRPKRMMAYDSEKYKESNREYWEYSDTEHQNVWEYFPNRGKYIEFIQTQALATHTDVTIEGNAFVKGSVYGGSENGLVQYDTDVKITGNCQIGEGEGATGRYTDSDWASESLAGCAHWDFDESSGAPYDPYAKYLNPADGKYYYDAGFTEYAEGGSNIAKDGHTYYGNVFGGGSGSVPYFDTTEGRSVYLNSAGTVKGNTKVTISGGHILTSVYGGCESTNVLGTSTVTMTAGTIGVPRTVEQIQAHPVICNLFGAGKGDQRVFFNKDTNVENAVVNVSGTAKIYGSVFGGGEDGHVLRNSKVTIGDGAVIGAFGYSGYDGNVFGGGRGFGGDALTAGNVSGDVEVNINGGSVLGSVYGGGRLASVGYGLYKTTEAGYGEMKDDGIDDAGNSVNGFTRGHVKVNITDGTIGNDTESTLTHTKGGNVFGGSMGRLTLLNGTTNPIWPKLARVKAAEVNIKGGTVKANVYGGGELGTVHTTSKVTVNKGTVNGNVFGGGYGSNDNVTKTEMDGVTYSAVQIAGRVDGTTTVEMNDGQVMKNLYGGGEMASVGVFTASDDMRTFTWGDPYNGTGVCNVTVAGGKIGTTAGSSSAGHVFGAGKGLEDTFWCEKGIVYSTNVNINKGTVNGNVYGGGEVGRVETDAIVKVEGTADIKGNVFGAGAGKETHGYSALVRGNTTVTVQGSAAVGKSVYGGGEIASVGKYGLDNKNMPSILMGGGYCYVTVQGNATVGADVFGAGEGVKSHFNNTDEDLSKRSRRMTLKSDWVSREGADRFDWDYLTESNYPTYLETLALATHPEVTIDGSASIGQSVYGGGELGLTKGSVIVNIKGGTITEDVYGGGSLANTNTTSTVGHTDADGNVTTETVHPTTTVNLLGGTVTRNVYGGGLGQKEVKTGETVTTPGIEAIVYGDVNVNLNGTTTITTDDATGNKTYTPSPNDPTKKGCVVKGNVFGANNVNGTPLGHVLVYVHGTQNENTSAINVKADGSYDVAKVFGGGNQADYVPTDTKQSTEVIIEGCVLTSIEEVYGGGYGAAVPATNVLVKGTKIIDNVYGGGYGASTDDFTNPGANVGYLTDGTEYGAADGGKAVVQLMAGTVNHVYGGSNSLGNIRGGSNVTSVARGLGDTTPSCCTELKVQDIFGGGKNADMFGGAEIVLGCMPNDWVGAIYAGAESSDIGHDVSLTLTSGKFGRVFGGNKSGGKLNGGIEVNIEENGSCGTPIIIGELYGGGNEAPYSIYGYKDEKDSNGKWIPRLKADYDVLTDAQKEAEGIKSGPNHDPVLNIRAFTSIGNIFGGGYGQTAKVVGNPIVNINEVEITHTDTDDAFEGNEYAGETKELKDDNNAITNVVLYPHKDGKMGVIGNVFGGGNAAEVIGNTNVNIGTETEVGFESLRTSEGVPMKTVKGADIRGNVYGGGNAAEVTGNTNVVIGKEATTP